jgi:hypothetical protein
MKTLRLSQLCLVGALALGIMVLWTSGAPSAPVENSVTGGWLAIGDECCENWSVANCSDGTDSSFGPYNCGGTTTKVCLVVSSGPSMCAVGTNNNCTGNGTSSHPNCTIGADTTCD